MYKRQMYDRMIVGGARPVGEVLKLEAIDPLKAPCFLTRREMGIFNVGGPGVVKAGDAVFELDYKEGGLCTMTNQYLPRIILRISIRCLKNGKFPSNLQILVMWLLSM